MGKFKEFTQEQRKEICLSRKREKFENFIKDRGSETTITNPIYGDAEYKDLCYLED